MFCLPFHSFVFPLPPQRSTVNHYVPPVNDLMKISSQQNPWSAPRAAKFPQKPPKHPRIPLAPTPVPPGRARLLHEAHAEHHSSSVPPLA